MATRALASLVVLAALLVPAVSRAEEHPALARARASLGELKYEQARQQLAEALRSGTCGPRDLIEIYRLTGEVTAALGDPRQAQTAFAALLTLDPSARLGAGVSPKLSGPFQAAKEATAGKRLVVSHRVERGPPPVITVLVEEDPLEMVTGARALVRTGRGRERKVEEAGLNRVALKLPNAPELEVVVAALDQYGNRLVEIGTDEPIRIVVPRPPPPPPVAASPPPPPEPEGPPIVARWYLWGGLALGFAAAGTYFGLEALAAEDDLAALNDRTRDEPFAHESGAALRLEDDARRNALLSNIAFGGAAACAIAGTILHFTVRGGNEASTEPTASVVPVPTPGGAGLSATFRF